MELKFYVDNDLRGNDVYVAEFSKLSADDKIKVAGCLMDLMLGSSFGGVLDASV